MIGAALAHGRRKASDVTEVTIVGNTAMHHLFSGLDVAPLAAYPFEPRDLGMQTFSAAELGWDLPEQASIRFLPCLGGFVGSDLLAGILACEMHRAEKLTALVDLGTNGEIILGNHQRILCASTAAGPAFEGACISMGMRAAEGAITAAERNNGSIACRVMGGGRARGICGSGLVDVVSCALDLEWIQASGRFSDGGASLALPEGISISQGDIRQLQLAKGAIAAGLRILLERLDASIADVETLYLAGAFGNYISLRGAQRIGLLHAPISRIHPAGNTALLGAKMALFEDAEKEISAILAKTEHVALGADARFQDVFVEEMLFPEPID